MKKKIAVAIISVFLSLSVFGCGNGKKVSSSSSGSGENSSQTTVSQTVESSSDESQATQAASENVTENKLFDVQLNEKYLQNTEAELYVSDREQEWLSKHKTIRVGYQNNYLAFCSKDERTGELIGALNLFGGALGGWLFDMLGIEWGGLLGQLGTAIIGAVAILWIASFFKK